MIAPENIVVPAPAHRARRAVTVCLPTLNSMAFLRERLESLDAQTFQDWDLVVVDGFSTDGTWEALQSWASKAGRSSRFEQRPKGLYQAWNRCLELAEGEWIYFATSDDLMRPDCLARLLEAGRRNPEVGIVTSLPWPVDERGATLALRRDWMGRLLAGRRTWTSGCTDARVETVWALLVGTPTLSVTQMLVARRMFVELGGFPTQYGSGGDYAWQLRALQHAPVYHVGRRLGAWRVHGSQATPAGGAGLDRLRAAIVLDWVQDPSVRLDATLERVVAHCLWVGGLTEEPRIPAGVRAWFPEVERLRRERRWWNSPVLLAARWGRQRG